MGAGEDVSVRRVDTLGERAAETDVTGRPRIKVIHVVPSVSRGGIESLVLDLAKNIDANLIEFEIAALNPNDPVHLDEFTELGVAVHFIGNAGSGTSLWSKVLWRLQAIRNFQRLTGENSYGALHCHLGLSHGPYTLTAWARRIPVRIAHVHRSAERGESRFRWRVRRVRSVLTLEFLVTQRVGCGDLATEWLWGSRAVRKGKAKTVYNGVDIQRFTALRHRRVSADDHERNLNVLHVGRFTRQKNQAFLLDIFSEVVERDGRAKLHLVGFGPLEGSLKDKVEELGLTEAVVFYDQSADVSPLLKIADVFLLPSLWEGLPIVAIESQLAGVPLVTSTAVTREIDMGLAVFVSLEESSRNWAVKTMQAAYSPEFGEVAAADTEKFDIKNIASQWARIYTSAS